MYINSISPKQSIAVDYNNQQTTSTDKVKQKQNQDTVVISNTGRQLSIGKETKLENIDRMNRMLNEAKNNPDYAKTFAKDLAHSDFLMGVDVSTISEGGNISLTRYTNGNIINKASTKISVQNWENKAEQYKEENIKLYNTEKSKGTSDVNIIMMIMEKNMGLPESFRKQQGNNYL